MPDLTWFQVDVGYACGGVGVHPSSGTVAETAPIFRWMIGKQFSDVVRWRKIRKVNLA